MISVQKFIFPGIIAGCLFVVFATSLIASPNIALASNVTPIVAAADASAALPIAATATAFLPAGAAEDGSNPAAIAPTILPTEAQPQAVPTAALPVPTLAPTMPPPPQPTVEPTSAPAEQPAAPAAPPASAAAPETAAAQPAAADQAASGCTINASYPQSVQQWCALIQTYSAKNNVDANLLAAVILQESGGDAQAYSSNGAVGLMQVMPRDGLAADFMCARGPCFASRPSSSELFDPEFNIAYGSRMLAGLIKKYGDVREALRFYGPSNMGYRYADIVLSIIQRYQ